ncbi:AAA family ATPase [Paraliobacillus sp. X-1268]|uniref:AAA family ATPase n=1 Tax=Paraliobacillus sp. X-1268 TaxID=2213193 RepID=UPI000E3E573B|nr:AAA family ATPase [Paraliobacillus sp. X-1268]
MINSYSSECLEVLRLLKKRRNVLISGPPGCGKSRLLNEVANAFVDSPVSSEPASLPVLVPNSDVAIPRNIETEDNELQQVWPADKRTNRQIVRTVFHQQTKHREFISGLAPLTNGQNGFTVVGGTLYLASEHAKKPDGAALLIIDEINRGPAVNVFGGSIAAIEPEKRLEDDNSVGLNTQFFRITDPESGSDIEYALPKHLYILAAMNQADTSVEPLDVAFLRRWAPYKLQPNYELLRELFSIEEKKQETLPSVPTDIKDVLEAAVRALQAVNQRIRYGKGKEFQIGHGIFLTSDIVRQQGVDNILIEVAEIWGYIQEHIEEVFFGDLFGIATVLNVINGNKLHPFKLEEISFGGEPRIDLKGPTAVNSSNIYDLLRAVVGDA